MFFYFLSGLIIPLQLFPEPVPTISRWSPLIAVNHLLTLSSETDPLTNQNTTFLQSWIQAGQPLTALTVWLVFLHTLGQQDLTDAVVDLVRAAVVQVLPFQEEPSPSQVL